jgi:IS30 family transposase
MGKHLLKPERAFIEKSLNSGCSLHSIAVQLEKSPSTISREIRTHRSISPIKNYGRINNRCVKRNSCSLFRICKDNPNCMRKCRSCKKCNALCSDFIEEHCQKLEHPPYVCNGCVDKQSCPLKKYVYSAEKADADYRKRLSEARSGFNLSDSELNYIDEICSPLLKNGQSVYHVISTNKNKLLCSERTLYRLVNSSALSARNIDMPRVCRLKPRKNKNQTAKVDRSCRIGRTFADFNSFMNDHPDAGLAEIDSVIGRVGGKLLLTIHIKSIDFMIAFLREHNTADSVGECFKFLRTTLDEKVYRALFHTILTDNGSEFSNPKLIENDENGNTVSHLFYCDPSSPYQKPNVELNHEFIRRFIPKGSSMDNLTQRDVDLMMSHINSYSREKFSGLSPAKIFIDMFGENVLHLLRQELIPSEKIILNGTIFKSKVD